ncbi:MAG: ArsC/Spx/MgsR family protein [Acidimicrobiales bacterium]|nr:arsenate reductase [Acidimicrobiaceae bacterium]MDG1088695.1 ArsC/Spx/MgsR family protein [Acidimicrobiales bacterium]
MEYLQDPLVESTLRGIIAKLTDPVADMVRHDGHFVELGLDDDGYTSEDDVVDVLLAHPKLMQRPIAVVGDRAVIGRPSERVLEVLES